MLTPVGGMDPEDDHRNLDWKALAALTDGDRTFQRDLLQIFVETVPTLLGEIVQSCMTSAFDDLVYRAHTLRGSCRAICAISAAESAHALELDGRGENRRDSLIHLDALKSEVWKLLIEIRTYLDRGC